MSESIEYTDDAAITPVAEGDDAHVESSMAAASADGGAPPPAGGAPTFWGKVKAWLDLDRYGTLTIGKPDFQTIFIIVSTLILLSTFWYFGRTGFFKANLRKIIVIDGYDKLLPFFYFSLNAVFYRTVLPILIIFFVFKKRPRDFGYKFKGTFELWYVYLILFLLVAPVVFFAGYFDTFQNKYPMGNGILDGNQLIWSKFLIYELFYGLIFVSGESFWRGYILFGLEKKLGYYSLFVMVIPYTMAHYGKPYPETLGAILTGVILGYLALRHRSFWLGVATHWAVAMWMDFTALYFKGTSFF